jgi:hypothetical protein
MLAPLAYLGGLLLFLGLCAYFALKPRNELGGYDPYRASFGDVPRTPGDLKFPVHHAERNSR